ncbi:hypothetical protein ACFPH6_31760 [Streptomyces xiangluensis]|uniref:Uncharacterized protein n=1 Tax=Streptomyces xiangluensis TaxID=2665720 RepID=A0ABV8YYC3_9ACTN
MPIPTHGVRGGAHGAGNLLIRRIGQRRTEGLGPGLAGSPSIAASGMLFLSESANAAKLLDIALVIAGMGRFNTCA